MQNIELLIKDLKNFCKFGDPSVSNPGTSLT